MTEVSSLVPNWNTLYAFPLSLFLRFSMLTSTCTNDSDTKTIQKFVNQMEQKNENEMTMKTILISFVVCIENFFSRFSFENWQFCCDLFSKYIFNENRT